MSLVEVAVSPPGQGFPPEHWAQLAADRILFIADDAKVPGAVRRQAVEFKGQIQAVIAHYVEHATRERRAISESIAAARGRDDIAQAIRAAP